MPDAPIRIERELEAIADPAYRTFQTKLVPTVDAARKRQVCAWHHLVDCSRSRYSRPRYAKNDSSAARPVSKRSRWCCM